MSDFFNPYAFIPVTGKPTGITPFAGIKQGNHPHIRHDLWAKDTHSGRMVCSLTLKTPTLVGSRRTPGDKYNKTPASLTAYKIGKAHYIPGNSLRGMIGSLLEAISQSTLRVLSDSEYSVTIDGNKTPKKVNGKVYQAFRNIDINTIPWGNSNRTDLTPAESLLGVVAEEQGDNDGKSRNLASRVRFYDAFPIKQTKAFTTNFPLKILAGPKPPAPCMYFSGDGIARKKDDLDLTRHQPSGRKYYLHHRNILEDKNSKPNRSWETNNQNKNADQKTNCELLEPNQTFYFSIDFDNLDDAELGLLHTALKPDDNFLHRLGLGKPLGLGSVKIEVCGIFTIDRGKRYTVVGLDENRYAHAYNVCGNWTNAALAKHFPHEVEAAKEAAIQAPLTLSSALVDKDTLKILAALGNPNALSPKLSVCYPVVNHITPGNEEKGYEWFSHNEKSHPPQCLRPISKDGKIEPLKSN